MRGQDLDDCLQLVADRYRRRLIQQLRHETAGKTVIGDLVDRMHGDELQSDDRSMDREQLAIHLSHISLPKLAEQGVVEYDRESGIVRYQPNNRVEAILDSLPADRPVAGEHV